MRSLSRGALAALAGALLLPAYAMAASSCDGQIGTSRVLEVNPVGLQVGTQHFPQTLDLHDGEVVLTFDDGPHPGTTEQVLKALAHACVRATFFVVGAHAAEHPGLLKRIIAEGHTVGHHSLTHPMTLADISYDKAVAEIERGFTADDKAAYGAAGAHPRVPFFRFPGFGSSPELLEYLSKRGVGVFGADLWAGDWNPMTPEEQLTLTMHRLDHAKRGIILFHDTRSQTARMMPMFLATLKEKGYRIVHIVPAAAAVTASVPE